MNKYEFCPFAYRKLRADVTEKITNLEEELSVIALNSNGTDTELSALETDAKSLDRVVKLLAEQLELIKISDVRGECITVCREAGGGK